MIKKELVEGDILQINPENGHKFAGMLVIVDEPTSWGCQGYLMSHYNFEAVRCLPSQKAFVRVKFEDVEHVGRVEWIMQDQPNKGLTEDEEC